MSEAKRVFHVNFEELHSLSLEDLKKQIINTYMKKDKGQGTSIIALQKNKFKDRISFSEHYNLAVFKIFSDYFNIVHQNKEKQERDEIEMIGLIHNEFVDTIQLYGSLGSKEVWFKILGLTIKMGFHIFKSNGEVFYEIYLTSAEHTDFKSRFIYDEMFQRALKESELAGSYITMVANEFRWEVKPLEKRTMNDIYLPEKQMEDLQMLIDVYVNNGELLRYLMVGVPGTGKTESCLTLMNELKNKNVTIIKTPVCKFLSEKVKLAVLLKPCIIIFDDLDLSLGSRNSGGWSGMLQSFLDILDGTDKLPKDVGILATTNSAYLLDLAAQRPGRFSKVMIFDELTKDNIRNIIFKSLKYNFGTIEKTVINIFSDQKIIDKFHSSQVTGSQIYTSVSMMKLKYDMLMKAKKEGVKLSVHWLLSEIDEEIKILEKVHSQQKITDKLNNGRDSRKIGFGQHQENEECLADENEVEEMVTEYDCDKRAPNKFE